MPYFAPDAAHAYYLLRAEIGGYKGESRYPGRNRAPRQEKVGARFHISFERKPYAQDEHKVNEHYDPIEAC